MCGVLQARLPVGSPSVLPAPVNFLSLRAKVDTPRVLSGSVLAVSCRSLVGYAKSHGLSTEQWLRDAGMSAEELDDPDARLSPDRIFALWRAAYAQADDPALALHVAESLPRGAYRAVEYLAAHAATIGEAYTKVAKYFSVIDATTQISITTDADVVTFGPRAVSADPASYPAIEYMLAACYLRVLDMTGVPHRPTFVAFAVAQQPDRAEVERVFGCPSHWSAGVNQLGFAGSDWSRPTANPDAMLLGVLEEHAEILKNRYPESDAFLALLDQVLEGAWADGEPSLEATARRLGMSARTLQRRLAENGASFSAHVDDARRRTALRWLTSSDLSLAEIAHLVGFAEQASLTRAVRRWTGQTPRELRKTKAPPRPA